MTARPMSGAELTRAYRSGQRSPIDVAAEMIAKAELAGDLHNAIATMNTDQALEQAAASDRRWKSGEPLGPLDGVPVSVKDSFPMRGLKRWHGSAVHDHLPPSTHDGAPVRRLREAGAVLFAKTSMPDFGLIASGLSSQFGTITNPWDPALSPGGSSSGAAVLLAMGVGPMSVGTDMGGSVRTPAAQCGVVGLKPTQGRVAYDPPKLVGSAGPMGRTVDDAVALLEVIGAPDAADHLSLPGRFARLEPPLARVDGLRVGLTLETAPGMQSVEPEVAATVEAQARLLESLGATIVPLPPVMTPDDGRTHGRHLLAKGMPEMVDAPGERRDAVPQRLRDALGGLVDMTAIEYLRLEKAVDAIRARWAAAFDAVDIVLSPVLPVVGFPADSPGPVGREGGEFGHLMFTQPYNLTGLPAGTVPAGISTSGLPIGVQVGGRRFDDALILAILALLESAREFDLDYPDLAMPSGGSR